MSGAFLVGGSTRQRFPVDWPPIVNLEEVYVQRTALSTDLLSLSRRCMSGASNSVRQIDIGMCGGL